MSPLFKSCHCAKDLFEDSTDTEKKRRVLPQAPGRKEVIIGNFIIWLNPRAGNVKRFLCTDWLPQRARWANRTRSGFSALRMKSRERKFSFVQFLYILLIGSTLFGQDSGHWHRVFIKKQKKQTWPIYGI